MVIRCTKSDTEDKITNQINKERDEITERLTPGLRLYKPSQHENNQSRV